MGEGETEPQREGDRFRGSESQKEGDRDTEGKRYRERGQRLRERGTETQREKHRDLGGQGPRDPERGGKRQR